MSASVPGVEDVLGRNDLTWERVGSSWKGRSSRSSAEDESFPEGGYHPPLSTRMRLKVCGKPELRKKFFSRDLLPFF